MCALKMYFVLIGTVIIQCFHGSGMSKSQTVHSTGVKNLIQRNVEKQHQKHKNTSVVQSTSAKVCQKATKL